MSFGGGMTKYKVIVDRISVRSTSFIVEAPNETEAEWHADYLASNFDFNVKTECDITYEYYVEELPNQ
jgi:hypothetical protein